MIYLDTKTDFHNIKITPRFQTLYVIFEITNELTKEKLTNENILSPTGTGIDFELEVKESESFEIEVCEDTLLLSKVVYQNFINYRNNVLGIQTENENYNNIEIEFDKVIVWRGKAKALK